MGVTTPGRGAATGRWSGAAWLSLAVLAVAGTPAAAQTRAGTAIVNVATLHHDAATLASSPVTLIVAERLDVAIARTPTADVVLADGTPALGVTITNGGNGDEAFVVAAAATSGSATLGSPQASGAPLADGRTTRLGPGAAVTLLLPVGGATADAVLDVTVRAATGSGAPGTVFAGAGDSGGDAVVGPTGAVARLSIPLVTTGAAAPTLEKRQSVLAPDGSASAVAGAAVTYTLVARFAAACTAADLADAVPAGTTYRAGSLTLDGIALDDAGHVAAGQIAVPLGAVAAGTTRTLRFTVVIS